MKNLECYVTFSSTISVSKLMGMFLEEYIVIATKFVNITNQTLVKIVLH